MNLRRRLNIHKQHNIILIILLIIVVVCINLTINLIENERLNPSKSWICPQLSSSSKRYFRVDFAENCSINNSLICKSNDILLIYILSTARNFERRQLIRQTWARKKAYQQLNDTCFIFLVGLSTYNSSLPFNGDIQREASIYGDIVQLNYFETYQNVIYKEVGALKWSHIYASHVPFLFKTDDDLILDSLLLTDIVKFFIRNRTDHSIYLQKHREMQQFIKQMLNVDKYTFFKGRNLGGIPTFRYGKYKIHQLAWNDDQLPPYCSGFGFLYSSFIRDRLYRASLCYEIDYVPLVADVFVSGFIAGAASVRCSGWSMLESETSENCLPLFKKYPSLLVCSSSLHIKRKIDSDFNTSWQAIHNRHINQINYKY